MRLMDCASEVSNDGVFDSSFQFAVDRWRKSELGVYQMGVLLVCVMLLPLEVFVVSTGHLVKPQSRLFLRQHN